MERFLQVESQGALQIWTIDRPNRRHALGAVLTQQLLEQVEKSKDDSTLRAVVITATGDKAFCAGADLKERASMAEAQVIEQVRGYRRLFAALDAFPRPVIAAINGVAFGGGLELALACDFRIAAHHAELGLTETSLGIIPGAGGTQRLTRIVGEARAKEMILLAQRLSARQALNIGLVHQITEPAQSVRDLACHYAQSLCQAAPLAMQSALEAVDGAWAHSMDEGLTIEWKAYERTLKSQDRVEALKAFAAKRKPNFQGR